MKIHLQICIRFIHFSYWTKHLIDKIKTYEQIWFKCIKCVIDFSFVHCNPSWICNVIRKLADQIFETPLLLGRKNKGQFA